MEARCITIPATRTKTKTAFEIPITEPMAQLLNSLPRFVGGNFVFSSRGGRSAFQGHHKAQQQLKEICGVTGFTRHDIRRTARSHFSALPVQDHVREIAIGHRQPGVRGIYDRHRYYNEHLELLTLWHRRLASIVDPPPPADVIPLKRRRVLAAAE